MAAPPGMSYAGGKNGAGVFQTIINQIPPHPRFYEAFAGSAAVFRNKRPAAVTTLIERDPARVADLLSMLLEKGYFCQWPAIEAGASVSAWKRALERRGILGVGAAPGAQFIFAAPGTTGPAAVSVIYDDAISWLAGRQLAADDLIYCDPPYLATSRRSQRRIYECEMMGAEDHNRFLDVAMMLPARVIIEGYPSELYADRLKDWRSVEYLYSTRGGPMRVLLWMNYPEPAELHDYSYFGGNFRQRQNFRRMRDRWIRKLESMPAVQRHALLLAIRESKK